MSQPGAPRVLGVLGPATSPGERGPKPLNECVSVLGPSDPVCPPLGAPLTFALQALAKETLEEFLASLADGGPRVAVDEERVRDLHLGQQHLVQLYRAARVGGGRR